MSRVASYSDTPVADQMDPVSGTLGVSFTGTEPEFVLDSA
jgi:hypothetical protein